MVSPKRLLPKNIFTNWLSLLVNAIVAFFLNPFLIHRLGTEDFGVWALIFSIVGYTDFFDLGVRQSLAKYLPKYYALKDDQKLNEVINSGNAIYAVAGGLTFLAAVLIALFGADLIKVDPDKLTVMRWTLVIIGANAATIFLMMPSSSIGPFHRYDVRNSITITFRILETLAIVFFVWRGIGLIELAVIVLISTITRSAVGRWYQQRLVPVIKISLSYVKKSMIRELLGYGTYSFLIVIATLVIFQSDYILIGTFINAETVTYYAVATIILQYLRSIVQAAGLPLAPAISHFEATSDMGEVNEISRKMLKYVQYLSASICAGLIVFGGDFVGLWMGDGFGLSVEILIILVVPAIIYLPQTTSNAILFGLGKHKLLFQILAVEATTKIILSLILLQFYGVYGIAFGTAIPQVIIYSLVYPIAYHRAIEAKVSTFYVDAIKTILISALFTVPIALVLKQFWTIDSWGIFVAAVGITTVSLGAGFYWLVLDPEDTKRVIRLLRKPN